MLNLNKFILKSDFSIRRIRPRTTAIKIERKIMSNILNRINVFRKDRTRVVNLRLDKLGRAVQAQNICGPGRFLPIFREDFANIRLFFERTILNFK